MRKKMKDSGIEWIGKIPEDWDIIKGKYIYDITTGKLDANAEDIGGIYPFFTCSMEPKKINSYAFDCEALLVAGNGIVGFTQYYKGKFNAYQRTYVLSNFSKIINPKYLKFYVSDLLEEAVTTESYGSVISFIKLDNLKNFYVVFPSIAEQTKIANFLDDKCSKIDKAIELNKRAIDELEEYRTSLVSRMIKGHNKKCDFKDSNINYLGKIPGDWKLTRLGHVFYIKKDIAGKEGYDVLSITQSGIKIKNIEGNEGQLASDYSKYQLVKINDFAMNHMDLLTGWVDCSKYYGVTSPDYRVFNFIDELKYDRQYYLFMMQLFYKEKVFYGFGQGVSNLGRWRLPKDNFLNMIIPVPPIEEQKRIGQYLSNFNNLIKKDILIRQKYIEQLEEYKKSLIYEAVTGKIEV